MLKYKIVFAEGRAILQIFLDGVLKDELTLPNLPTNGGYLPTTQALWKSWAESHNL